MIDWGELGEWITMGLVGFLGMVAVAVLFGVVCDVIDAFQRSLRGGGTTPTQLSIEEVMERIPEFTYQQLPGTVVLPTTTTAAGAATRRRDDSSREKCVICLSAYEPAGEACGVLPDCEHVFHKLCVAPWLRQNSTCPICRAAFAVTDDDDARQDDAVTAVENMV